MDSVLKNYRRDLDIMIIVYEMKTKKKKPKSETTAETCL